MRLADIGSSLAKRSISSSASTIFRFFKRVSARAAMTRVRRLSGRAASQSAPGACSMTSAGVIGL